MRHIIKLSLVLLAVVTTFFVYDTMLMVSPWWVAVASSISLASVYVGLAFTPIPHHQRGTAVTIAGSALGIEASMGIVHALRIMAPSLFVDMPMWAIIGMSVLFGVPFSALLFAVAHFVVHQHGGDDDNPMSQTLVHIARLAEASNANAQAIARFAEASESAPQALTKTSTAFSCPNCGGELSQGQYGAAMRHGYCSACKPSNGNGHKKESVEDMEVEL
jgi:predicted RNA-binding Zn-ribbon protein involved in translation (DUF1610 family)